MKQLLSLCPICSLCCVCISILFLKLLRISYICHAPLPLNTSVYKIPKIKDIFSYNHSIVIKFRKLNINIILLYLLYMAQLCQLA